jgi:hypothetical protein
MRLYGDTPAKGLSLLLAAERQFRSAIGSQQKLPQHVGYKSLYCAR